MKALLDSCKDPRKENVVVKNTGHLHQCDVASLIPLELFIVVARRRPQLTTNETYLLNSWLLMSFFERTGFGTGHMYAANRRIEEMSQRWLSYDMRYE